MTCTSSALMLLLQSKIEFFQTKIEGELPSKCQSKELNEPRMPAPSIIFDQGMPDVDNDTLLLPAMKKARDNEEQREEKIMYYALDLQYYNLVPSLCGWIPGMDVMDILHTKSQRFVFDNVSQHSKIIFPSASILNHFVI